MSRYDSMTKKELIAELESLNEVSLISAEEKTDHGDVCISGLPEAIPPIKIDSLVEGIWIVDHAGITVFANDPMGEILGYPPAEMKGQHLFSFMTEEAQRDCKDKLGRREAGVEEIHDFTFQSKSGEAVYTRVATSPIFNEQGEYAGAFASVVDLSDIHRLQKRLKTNFEKAPIGMLHLGLDGKIIRVNESFSDVMEYSHEELEGIPFVDITHPDDRESCVLYMDEAVKGAEQPKFTKRHITKSGKTLWIDLSLSLVQGEAGSPPFLIGLAEDVTVRHNAKEDLKRITRLMNEVQELGQIAGWEYDVATQRSFWTPNMYSLFGYSSEEIEDEHTFFHEKIVHPDDREELASLFNELFVKKKSISTEFRFFHKDGQEYFMSSHVVPQLDTKGNVVRIYGANQDITGRVKAQNHLRISERRFRKHFELGLVGMVLVSLDKRWALYNDKFCEILGYSRDELAEMTWPDFTHPDDVEDNLRLFNEVLSGKRDSYKMEKRYIRKDGETVHAVIYSKSISRDDGTLEYIITHIMDVTERVAAEKEASWNLNVNMALARLYAPLVSPNANLRNTSEAILNEAIKVTGSQHGYACTINEEGAAIQAFSDMMDSCKVVHSDGITFHKGEDGRYPSLWGQSLNTKKPLFTNQPMKHQAYKGLPEGHISLECFLSVPVQLGGRLVGQLAVANKPGGYSSRDLDALMRMGAYYALAIQRVESKKELLASKDLLERVLDGIQAGIMVVDPNTRRIESINDAALDMLQATKEDVIGKTCDIFCWQNVDGSEVVGCPARHSRIHDWELRMHRMDGSVLPVSKTVIEESVDGENKFIEIIFDITARKDLERRLSLAQKLESIGQLSAGIAHEINTPAQYLGDNMKFFAGAFTDILALASGFRECTTPKDGNDCEDDSCALSLSMWDDIDMDYLIEEIPPALVQSQDGVRRITSIVQAMKRFSHPGIDHKQYADINEALETTVTVCRNEWKYHSNVVFELTPGLPLVPCYINDLNQAFLNIVVNAAHAITSSVEGKDEQGVITIRTSKDGSWVIVEIEDTGIGIPESVLPRIFDPFFTTKEVGLGTGQGLALCYTIIVEKHGGTINYSSQPGAGTKCTIELPLGDANGRNE